MINKETLSQTDFLYNYVVSGSVLGYLEIRIVDNVIDIINIFVNEENRNQKIATSLMNHMFENEDYNKIMLEVNENNIIALNLYKKLGFKEISIRNKYYKEDAAIIMQKED
ncbi:MAG: GNAT family N-acetyltransferase [Tenericutes bacterium]|nr:GNAT family N-acetyltransferase [Mycoplasmatota bacterium]